MDITPPPTPAQEGLLGSESPGADASRQDTLEAGGRAPAQRPSHELLAAGSLPSWQVGIGAAPARKGSWTSLVFSTEGRCEQGGAEDLSALGPTDPYPTPPHPCAWRRKDVSVRLKHSYHSEPREVLLLGSLFPLGSAD